MPMERNKADGCREKAYEGDTKAMNNLGVCIGALLGMQVWHHKTMHKKFKYGLPLIMLVQIALTYFINK